MSRGAHPIAGIKEAAEDEGWFAADYHPGGVLSDHLVLFGRCLPRRALKVFWTWLWGSPSWHEEGIVHRDIKPQNIFLSAHGDLILGDFGLVFFADDLRTRLSGTLENVGTRVRMPAWAMGMRIEDVKPTLDVFGLGKVLWSMVSGLSFLRLWVLRPGDHSIWKSVSAEPLHQVRESVAFQCVEPHGVTAYPMPCNCLQKRPIAQIIERGGISFGKR